MIFFIYGDDAYRIKKKLNELLSPPQVPHTGLVLKYIDCANVSLQAVILELDAVSLFCDKRIVVLQKVFANQQVKDYIVSQGNKINTQPDLSVVVYETGLPKKDTTFKNFCGLAKTYYYPFLDGAALALWVEEEVKRCRGQITQQAAKCLADLAGNDLWHQEAEIKRLVAFKNGQTIENKDIFYFLAHDPEKDIFSFLDALAEKKKALALKLLRSYLSRGESPSYILSMIAFQIRNLLLIKECIEQRRLKSPAGVHPYVARKLAPMASRISVLELKKIYRQLFEVDKNIKLGEVNQALALEMVVAEM